MPCYRPLNAWQKAPGIQPIFSPPSRGDYTKLQLACGGCIGCRLERSRQWATRCIHEASLHRENSFVTLTYSDENHPNDGSLVKSHHQQFLKRLRWKYKKPIRYYMCGEYGELGRPHYHLLLFGHDFQDKEQFTEREGIITYTSEQLESLWKLGFSTVGDVTWQTAAYVSRYILKKQTGKAADEHYERFNPTTGELYRITPEYNAMSLKPAIGKDWYAAYRRDCYPKDFVTNNGRKFRVPKYYDKLLEQEDPEQLRAIKDERVRKAYLWEHDNTPARRAAKLACANARAEQLKRTLQ